MLKQIAVLMIILAASKVHADDICIVPVVGGQPKLPIEFEQPYRMATSPRRVPGFDGLIVKAFNRHELYEFNGESLTLIEDDFPHVWGFAFEHGIHLGPDGTAWGFGSRPRVIFRLGSNTSVWEPIEASRGYDRAFFDQGTGDVYWRVRTSKQLRRVSAKGAIEDVDLPIFDGAETVSFRTISELHGALSLTAPRSSYPRQSTSLWFQPLDGAWQKISLELPDGQRLLDTFQDAQIQSSGEFIRVFPSNSVFAPLIFRFSHSTLDFVTSLPAGTWEYHAASQNWIGRIGLYSRSTKTSWGFWKETPKTLTPHFLVLAPNETKAQRVPGLASQSDVVGERIFYHPQPITISGDNPVFLHADKGIVLFDGVPLSQKQTLPYDAVGDHPSVRSLGGLNIIQSEIGVFVLKDDLSFERVDNFPVENPWPHEIDIEYVDAWQSYLIIDRRTGEIHQSKDMELFTKVETGKQVKGVAGVLLNPTSVLLIGEEELLVATKKCVT